MLRPLIDKVRRLWNPVALQLWLKTAREKKGFAAFARQQLAIFLLTARRLRDDEVSRRAASLTYYTLLAIVPLLAVGFALFKAFGGLRKLEGPLRGFILDNLAIGRQDEIGHWLDNFINNINTGAIAGVGVLILFYSAAGLLGNVEKTFNRIWGVKKMRPLPLRFAIHWCVITLAPPLVGVSLSISAQLQRSEFAVAVTEWLPFGLGRLLISSAGVLAVCVAFVLLYVVIPNTRIRWRSALLGGLVGGLLWSLGKVLFVSVSAASTKYSAIYGALSALPLLMIWMYYSWLIVLFGMTYAYADQTVHTDALLSSTDVRPSAEFSERLATQLVAEVVQDFRDGKPAPTVLALADRCRTLPAVAEELVELLVAHRVLSELQPDGLMPASDPSRLTVADVLRVVRYEGGTPLELEAESALAARVKATLDQAEAQSRRLTEVDFASLVTQSR